jgi:hypothetical protein
VEKGREKKFRERNRVTGTGQGTGRREKGKGKRTGLSLKKGLRNGTGLWRDFGGT